MIACSSLYNLTIQWEGLLLPVIANAHILPVATALAWSSGWQEQGTQHVMDIAIAWGHMPGASLSNHLLQILLLLLPILPTAPQLLPPKDVLLMSCQLVNSNSAVYKVLKCCFFLLYFYSLGRYELCLSIICLNLNDLSYVTEMNWHWKQSIENDY